MFNEFNNSSKLVGKTNKKNFKKIESKPNKTEIIQKIKYNNESSYLRQYKKYFQKKLSIKYNILPKEYTLIELENFIKAKYCHSLAKFKEDILYNLDQEFLTKFYRKKESLAKIPLFSEFYKTYLSFFCAPTLSELNLNELIEEMVERKAKVFYQDHYDDEKEEKKEKKIINTIFFTNKIRKEISRKNTLTDLSKTTIDFITTTNKNSINSNNTINMLINEIGKEKENEKEKKKEKEKEKEKVKEKIYKNNFIKKNINQFRHKISNINKNDRINKIIKKIETSINNNNNKSTIKKKKKNILKDSSNNINQDGKPLTYRNYPDIRLKTIGNTTQTNINNKNIIANNTETNINKNHSKPLYQKINIVNNKIIIINSNRSKRNILKNNNDKYKKNNICSFSRNYNSNLYSIYNSNTTGILDSKDRITNSSNNKVTGASTFYIKTLNDNSHQKDLSSNDCHSLQTKSNNVHIKRRKIIKENNIFKNKDKQQQTNIQAYNNKKANSNLFSNYLNNYRNKNSNNSSISNTNNLKKKKLTNYQMFSKNIKNTKNVNNESNEKISSFYKMIRSTYSLCSNSSNKIKNVFKISNYNTIENVSKISTINKNIYRKQYSTQEQFKPKLQINNNSAINKKGLSLKNNKK